MTLAAIERRHIKVMEMDGRFNSTRRVGARRVSAPWVGRRGQGVGLVRKLGGGVFHHYEPAHHYERARVRGSKNVVRPR